MYRVDKYEHAHTDFQYQSEKHEQGSIELAQVVKAESHHNVWEKLLEEKEASFSLPVD